jgi:hypothetical protein
MEVSRNAWDFMTIAQNGRFQKHLGFHDCSAEWKFPKHLGFHNYSLGWKFPETPGISRL